MKANDFVKKFGWDEAKNRIRPEMTEMFFLGWGFYTRELRRLVESWELVSKLGGLHMAKADVIDLGGWEKTSPYWVKIKQAIADVESCNECI